MGETLLSAAHFQEILQFLKIFIVLKTLELSKCLNVSLSSHHKEPQKKI